MKYYTIYTTFASYADAEKLGSSLVTKRLAACVQIFEIKGSIYMWEGKLQKDTEFGMFIKTNSAKLDDVTDFIKIHHPYDVPQILVYEIKAGNREYLDFVDEIGGRCVPK